MGGVAKHLMHLYDDRTLTYNKIKKILSMASGGALEGTEKTDGFNIYLGIKNDKGVWAPAWARNKGDMKAQGRTFAELAGRKFAGGEKVKKVYLDAFRAYQKAVNSLNGSQIAAIFGENTNIFYNTEIQGPGASNVVNYDKNIISIHHVNHKIYNPETDQLELVDASKNSKILDELINQFEQATSDEDFSIRRTALLQLNKLQDDYDLNIALQRMQKAGFVGNMTIGEFLEIYLSSETERKLNFLSPDIQQDVVDRILEKDDFRSLTQIYKGFPIDVKQRIKQHVTNGSKMIKEAIWPIETAIHDFAVELLKGLKSAYILDENNEAELKRVKDEVEQAIRTIQAYQGPQKEEAHQILRDQLEKLKHHDKITTVVEGFVFQVGDQLYKFTGNFAPVNQLLGLFKYGRGKIPPFKQEPSQKIGEQPMEEPNIEESAQTYAIIPGKFKPPHRGHLDMVKHYATLADKVIILISPLAKKTPRGQEITAADSVKIWQIYLNAAGITNVDTEISEYNSPVQAAIEYGNNPKIAGSKILLGSSTKGGDAAARFGRNIQKYTPDVEIIDPLKYAYEPIGEELHASDFRTIIDDPEAIAVGAHLKYIPEEAENNIADILSIFEASMLEEEVNPLPVGIFLGLVERQYSKQVHAASSRAYAMLKERTSIESELAKLEKEPAIEKEEEEKEKKEADLEDTQDKLKAQAEKEREEIITEPEEELEEASSMAAGNIAGGMTKPPFAGLSVDKENEEEKKRSKLDDKNKLVKELYDYLLRAGAH